MALKSSYPKENDKILKKKIISSFWGVSGSPKPQKLLEGGFRGAGNPPKLGGEIFQNFNIFFGL